MFILIQTDDKMGIGKMWRERASVGLFSIFKRESVVSLEWLDPIAQTIVYRFPLQDRPIKVGTQLTVKESQAAVFVLNHNVADLLGPGRYTLHTDTLPVLCQLQGRKLGESSSIRASLYFVNTRLFTDVPYFAANPIVIEDADFGSIRFRVIGSYSFKVIDAEVFMKSIFDTNQIYDTAYLLGQHKSFLHQGLQAVYDEANISLMELAARKHEAAARTAEHLRARFAKIGIELSAFQIDAFELPGELEERIEAWKNEQMNLEQNDIEQNDNDKPVAAASEAPTDDGGTDTAADAETARHDAQCEACGQVLEHSMKFCPECGFKHTAIPL